MKVEHHYLGRILDDGVIVIYKLQWSSEFDGWFYRGASMATQILIDDGWEYICPATEEDPDQL